MSDSRIEWTDKVWNPTTGCTKGCSYCYARTMAGRLQGMGQEKYRHGFTPACHPSELEKPLRWKKPCRVFVNSMGDLFDPAIPFEFIDRVMAVVAICSHHTFQILTKYPERMEKYFNYDASPSCPRRGAVQFWLDVHYARTCPPEQFGKSGRIILGRENQWPLTNLWLGVTVKDQAAANERIPFLLKTPAAVRFVSIEPMIESVDLYRGGFSFLHNLKSPQGKKYPALDWVICGGMTGKDAVPMHPDWIRSLRDQCTAASVPFYFKQWGEWRPRIGAWEPKPFGIFPDGSYYQAGLLMGPINAEAVAIGKRHSGQQYDYVHRVGKKEAGSMIDGQEWKQFPEGVSGK